MEEACRPEAGARRVAWRATHRDAPGEELWQLVAEPTEGHRLDERTEAVGLGTLAEGLRHLRTLLAGHRANEVGVAARNAKVAVGQVFGVHT
tara:strand:+ start:852 stop:1127 length:276 start_codon:yes stop_codon:yes gene_type:complete